jgi:hypothetical protein
MMEAINPESFDKQPGKSRSIPKGLGMQDLSSLWNHRNLKGKKRLVPGPRSAPNPLAP